MSLVLRTLLLLASWLAAFAAFATPLHASDLWWNPDESGWGLNVIHQGDTVFATLFVYGSDGAPRWYSASNLATSGDGALHDRPLVFSGELHESSGNYFGFGYSDVSRRRVGMMTFELTGPDRANLRYDIDGVTVAKSLRRYVFREMDASGTYSGAQTQPEGSATGHVNDPLTITIAHGPSGFAMNTLDVAGVSCLYSGTPSPRGQLTSVSGSYSCTDGRTGNFTLSDLDVTRHGFTARLRGGKLGDPFFGKIAGVRTEVRAIRGDGWRTDLWWVAAESGWGVNVIEQGDTLFATFFVYDRDKRPRWYSAASLVFQGRGPSPDSTGFYSGVLHESTGPYYGTAFNPNAVTRRPAGTVEFEVFGNRVAQLRYVVDGVPVTKQVTQFAFRRNDSSGTYSGRLVEFVQSGSAIATRSTHLAVRIEDRDSSFVLTTQGPTGPCTYTGTRTPLSQYGQLLGIGGTFSCADGRSGSFDLVDLEVTFSGFTAELRVGNGAALIGGARTGLH